ncbi:MAG: formate dehydrogenase accessory protein FdhE [Bacillota bacterium]|jgi:FdhE protein|nr:formate dehydrogenase accessory protein FdhE [Bacillota bacterium]NLP23479.1 formate dehydrogenase accessory protein FdhE [Syntrophomonadaceae bacterium]
MVVKRGKINITEDESTRQAYQKYQVLKQTVDQWQQERSAHWLAVMVLAPKPPYLPILDLPEDAVIELWQRLNAVAGALITDAEAQELWKQFKDDPSTMNPELISNLHLALGGVAQLAANQARSQGVPAIGSSYVASDDPASSYLCPVCGEIATVGILKQPDGHRHLHCNTCGFEWTVKRMGCPYCRNEDSKQLTYLQNEEFPGIEVLVCQVCGRYIKEFDERQLQVRDYMWEDLRTLTLNFATERWLSENIKNRDHVH